jgi:hypothetical protein
MTALLVARIRHAGRIWHAEPMEEDGFELLDGSPLTRLRRTGTRVSTAEATLLPPVAPGKIFGIGVNYRGARATSSAAPTAASSSSISTT